MTETERKALGVMKKVAYYHPEAGTEVPSDFDVFVFLPDQSHAPFEQFLAELTGLTVVLRPIEGGGVYRKADQMYCRTLEQTVNIYVTQDEYERQEAEKVDGKLH